MDRGGVRLQVEVDEATARELDAIVTLMGDGTDRAAAARAALEAGLQALRERADRMAARSVTTCPRCGDQLRERQLDEIIELCGCAGCGGIWLDHESGRALLATMDWTAVRIAEMARDGAAKHPATNAALRCPACGEPLVRTEAGEVHVDICAVHGTWFDAGELAGVMHARRAERYRDIEPTDVGDENILMRIWRAGRAAQHALDRGERLFDADRFG